MLRIALLSSLLLLTACGKGSDDQPTVAAQPAVPGCTANRSLASEEIQASSLSGRNFLVKLSGAGFRVQSTKMILDSLGAKMESLREDLLAVEISVPTTAAELLDRLGAHLVDYVEPDYTLTHAAISDDTYVSKQWAHAKVGTAAAWKVSEGRANVVVAVLDSGVDIRHPDLRENIWVNPREIKNGIDDDGNGYVDDFHG
jgi:subtilisin family serine protease